MSAIISSSGRAHCSYIDFQLSNTPITLIQYFTHQKQDYLDRPLQISPPIAPIAILVPSPDGKSWNISHVITSSFPDSEDEISEPIDSEEIALSPQGIRIKDHEYLWENYPQAIQSRLDQNREKPHFDLLVAWLIRANSNFHLKKIKQFFIENSLKFSSELSNEYLPAWSETWCKFISTQYQDIDTLKNLFSYAFHRSRSSCGRMIEHVKINSQWISSLLFNKTYDFIRKRGSDKCYSLAYLLNSSQYPILGRSTINLTKALDQIYLRKKQKIQISTKPDKEKALRHLKKYWIQDRKELSEGRIPFSLQKKVEDITNEWDILESLQGVPGIIPFLGAFLYSSNKIRADLHQDIKAVIYTLHYSEGALSDFIHKQSSETLSKDNLLRLSLQIAHVLKVLKDRSIAHQDFKLDNFVIRRIDSLLEIAATDFGFAIHFDDTQKFRYKDVKGTPAYLSPEKSRWHKLALQAPESQECKDSRELINHCHLQSDLFSATLCIFELLENCKEDFPELELFFFLIHHRCKSESLEELYANIQFLAERADQYCESQNIEFLPPRELALYQLIKGLRSDPFLRATPEELIEALEILTNRYEKP